MKAFITRIFGGYAPCFEIKITGGGNGYYRIRQAEGRIHILADTKIHACCGVYRYLKEFMHINYSWCGNSELSPGEPVLPDREIYAPIKQKYISMFNYCTYGYSMVFWDWQRWEKELDFMALNGVNLPLFTVGSEAVWYKALIKNGLTEDEALSFISSPSHFPWQLMTNIEGVMPVMDKALLEQRLKLGRRIIERMLELGMTPVQTGFSGFVPRIFKEKYFKNSDIKKKIDWCGNTGTCELNPKDPLFEKFGLDFLNAQKELFGAYHFYACDPFHESEPPVTGKKYLRDVSKAIQNMYLKFDSEYRWVMQSWSIRKPIVTAVPKNRLLIFDLAGKRHRGTNHFWGYDYITGNLHNFGGRINMHGDLELLAKNQFAKKRFHKNAVGTGLFMEGINQNPLYYDLAFKMLTENKKIKLGEFLDDYALRRYGSPDKSLKQAVRLLAQSVYKKGTNDVENSSMICARPALEVKKSGPNSPFSIPYDGSLLLNALALLLKAYSPGLKDGYYFDIYDISRQLISNRLQCMSRQILTAYESRSRSEFDSRVSLFCRYLDLADSLLLSRSDFNLYAELNRAAQYTKNDEVNTRLLTAHKTLLTLWSDIETPDIFDYAWREWGGMIGEFYSKRWRMFFDYLSQEFSKPDRFDLKKERLLDRCYGRESFFANDFYKSLGEFEREWTKKPYECAAVTNDHTLTLDLARQAYEMLCAPAD